MIRQVRRLLLPVPRDRLPLRLGMLTGGLVLHGISGGLLIQSSLGADPWDVFHQGLSKTFGLAPGTWTILVGAVALLLWIPLRQRVGLGTVSNVIVIGIALNKTIDLVATPHLLVGRIGLLGAAIPLYAIATGAYIGAGMGPGPRDGLMTGIVARGHSIRVIRSAIELTVLLAGWLLGGTVGLGTVLFAVTIGPLLHLSIPALSLATRSKRWRASGPRRIRPRIDGR